MEQLEQIRAATSQAGMDRLAEVDQGQYQVTMSKPFFLVLETDNFLGFGNMLVELARPSQIALLQHIHDFMAGSPNTAL